MTRCRPSSTLFSLHDALPILGLYDGQKKRFALTVEGEELKRQEYVVAQVKVPEVSTSAPAFAFSPEWLASEQIGRASCRERGYVEGCEETAEKEGEKGDGICR